VIQDTPGRFKPLNWREIHRTLNRGVPPITPDLIIDEGQDLPANFFILCQLLSEHVTVFADQEQTLKKDNASVEEIKELLPSGPEETFQLRRNYRNSRAIAEFASHFYKGLPAGRPDLPDPDNSRAVEPPKRHEKWQDSADEIARWIKNNPEQTVGVFLPGASWAEKFTAYLKKESPANRKKNIQPYVRGNKTKAPPVDFTRPGAVVTWYGNAKGLEFDTVFVCELNRSRLPMDDPLTSNLFYVLSSRARSKLEFHYSGDGQPDLLALFPEQSP
jgi:DNA helicase IV